MNWIKRTSLTAASAVLVSSLGGCTWMHQNPTACKVLAGATGATLGAVGGAVGEHNLGGDGGNATNGEKAAAASVGMVGGALIGFVIGHFVCTPEPPPPPPPPPVVRTPPPPPPPPTERRGG